MNLSVDKLCSVVKGQLIHKAKKSTGVITGVSIDSREPDLKGRVFFAIKGENFDGHDFLQQAVKAGAVLLIVQKNTLKGFEDFTHTSVVQVDHTLKALHRLAVYWRKKTGVRVIAVTGSNGKTTTKHFCLTLLRKALPDAQNAKVIGNPKSFNNMYGVPLTLLSAGENTEIIIQEMGMNQKGEIKTLCELARPDIVAVTCVGRAHIGLLGSQNEIAKEKEQIYAGSPKAIKIFNGDDLYTKAMYEKYNKPKSGDIKGTASEDTEGFSEKPKRLKTGKNQVLCFSAKDKTADVFLQVKEATQCSLSVEGHIQGVWGASSLQVSGPAHLNNILTAVCLALSAGVKADQIWKGLAFCRLPSGRNQWVRLSSGACALFDAYNAGPESIMAFLDYFLSPVVKGKKILILSDFLEIGNYLKTVQKNIAVKLTQKPVSLIWLIGSQAGSLAKALKTAGCQTEIYLSEQCDPAVIKKILSLLDASTVLAFKASRRMQMENVLSHFKPLDFSL